MTVLVDEIGALAADNINTVLSHHDDPWDKLVAGGWASIGADADAGLSVRDLQEVARVCGRHAAAHPLVPTLLAGRWFALEPTVLDRGVAVALASTDGALVPYVRGAQTTVDGRGADVEVSGVTDDFSAVMPLAVTDTQVTALDAERAAELRAVLAAVAVGCVDAVEERSVQWVQTREQFGRPIMTFQAVRHHLANLHIAREQAWTAAVAAAHEPELAERWARQACELATTAIELGIQVHGGVGFTAEVGLHLFLDHVLQIERVLGSVA